MSCAACREPSLPAPWRVIASLWPAGAGPIVPARAKRPSSPVRGWDRSLGKRYPNAPCRLWSDTSTGPGDGGGGPYPRWGPSPFLSVVKQERLPVDRPARPVEATWSVIGAAHPVEIAWPIIGSPHAVEATAVETTPVVPIVRHRPRSTDIDCPSHMIDRRRRRRVHDTPRDDDGRDRIVDVRVVVVDPCRTRVAASERRRRGQHQRSERDNKLHGSLPIQVLDHYALENEPSLTEFPCSTAGSRRLPLGVRSSVRFRRVPPPPYAAHGSGG